MTPQTHVLYVDDEDSLRILVKNQLELEGFSVEVADDGDTAIAMLGRSSYDVILLDIRMPRLNGMEVLKWLKSSKARSRVIMLTAFDDVAVALESMKNGANDYLTKPYELADLVARINRVVAK
jgi:DNA-binding response OmpR family regulator